MSDKNFTYVENDVEGEKTLNVISKADKFNYWMYKTIRQYTHGKILEIGSGIGNISYYFLKEQHNIALSDIRKSYCENLKSKFDIYSNLDSVLELNLTDVDFDKKFNQYFNSFDSIFSLNVIEHIENDSLAIANLKKLLKPKGTLITLVPAYNSIYCNFDKELQHFRRYNKKVLKKLVEKNGLKSSKSFYFNFIGILGWFVSGKILKKKTIPEGQMKLYNFLVPIFKLADFILFRSMGLSVINVAIKD